MHAPKISVFGGFYPKNLGAHSSDSEKALPCAERRVLSPHWSRSDAQCDLWPWQRKRKKKERKRQWQTGYSPTPPRYRIKVKVCMPGGLRCVVLYNEVLLKSF